MVMIWSAPATDNILATSLAEIGARLCEIKQDNVTYNYDFVAQWIQYLLGVWEVKGSITIRDSDF